jgi:amino acid transporter
MKREIKEILPLLSIALAMLILFLFNNHIFLIYIALALISISIFVPYLAIKASALLNKVTQFIFLSVFYILLFITHIFIFTPMGYIKRKSSKSKFYNGEKTDSNFIKFNKKYSSDFFEKMG